MIHVTKSCFFNIIIWRYISRNIILMRYICIYIFFFFVIYCHLSKLSVGQTPRLYNLPSKSYSNNINVPHPGGNDLVKESGKPLNGMPIKF